jgi:glycosyltransferase involved in cell wall biosynthesis
MRLVCYGWVDERGGSVASADYLVVKELLRRGVAIDFYANEQHVPEPTGLACPNFRYLGFAPPALYRSLSPRVQRFFNWGGAPIVRALWRRIFEPAARREHRQRPYDAVLSLGTPAAFTLDEVPTISWVQGPPHTELEAVLRLRSQITAVSGRGFWLALVALYGWRRLMDRRVLNPSQQIVCGSQWSRRAIIDRGADPRRVHALPYPIDLEIFRPPARDSALDPDRPVLLSLGRLDPRKRLDLLLDAFALVLDELPGARLRIIGSPGYAPRQLSLLDRFSYRDRVDYRPRVPRSEVPRLLHESTVLVQTSENENYGSAVTEALACGVPVAVGPTNGTADYIDENSISFESYGPEHVAHAVRTIVERVRARPHEVRTTTREAAERWLQAGTVVDALTTIMEADTRRPRPRVQSSPQIDAVDRVKSGHDST